MSKTNFIIIGIIILVVIILFSIYSPKDINSIIGNDLMDRTYTKVHILETCSWLHPKEAESDDIEKINKLLEHLKSYNFRKSSRTSFYPGSFKSYNIFLQHKDGQMNIKTYGDEYITTAITRVNHTNIHKTYKISNKKLDTEFLSEYFKSLYEQYDVNVPEEPPGIDITNNKQAINYIIGKDKWNGTSYDREDTFKTILKDDSGIEIPYIELDSVVTLDFNNYPPKEIRIYDNYIDEYGNNIFDKKVSSILVDTKIEGGKATFKVSRHMAVMLSSNSDSYGKAAALRGFRVFCTWGDNKCEYAFIIRTDG